MKLTKAHITNFRSVLDTGEFTFSGTTCLVGKNESGKTTVLQALERLNPYDPKRAKFNRDLDYPRGNLAEYDERHVLLATEFCGKDEADIEDLFGDELFLAIVNAAYQIPQTSSLKLDKLPAGPGRSQRIVQRVESAMKLVPEVAEFDHFQQSSWLVQHPADIKMSDYPAALDNFERLFEAINRLLPA